MSRGLQLRVAGRWLAGIGAWSGLTYSTLAAGGSGTCAWNMQLPATFAHPALRRGALVEVVGGAQPLYAGTLSEPVNGDNGWTFNADGLYLAAGSSSQAGFLALDAGGNATTTPDTAIDQAISRGLGWTRPASIGPTALTTPTDSDPLMYLGDLLDLAATTASQRWGVGPDRAVYLRADPTAPQWQMTPGSGRFGLADTDYASTVYVRYKASATPTYATASASDTDAATRYGAAEYPADLTALGVLTSGGAGDIASGIIAAGKPRLGWTNSVTPGRYQLTTMGGVPAEPWLVRGGQRVRLHGVTDEQGQPVPYVDFTIGEAAYDVDNDALTLSPVGLVARDSVVDMIASLVQVAS